MPKNLSSRKNKVRRRGTNPLLSERYIIDVLSVAVGPESIMHLRSAIMSPLVAAYDRRITRDEFIEMIDDALKMRDALGRLEMLISIDNLMQIDDFDAEKVREALTGLTNTAEAKRASMIKRMELIAQLPCEDDPIN